MILLRHSGETCAAMGDSTFVFPAASDGYWLMLNPLPPGLHTINFRWDQQDYRLPDRHHLLDYGVVPKGQF